MKKQDAWLIGTVLLLAVVGLLLIGRFYSARGIYAEVTIKGQLVMRIQMDGPVRQYAFEGNVIEVGGGRAAIVEADCPDGLCVKTSWLQNAGEMAICLPHQLVLRIIGESEVDGIAY